MKQFYALALILAAGGTAWAAPVQTQGDFDNYPMIGGENITRTALSSPGAPESAAAVLSGIDSGSGYVAFAAATGALGFDDYTAIGTGPHDLSEFRFVGGVVVAGDALFFDFFDAGSAFIGGFGVALPSAGNFIWAINLASGTILAEGSGLVQISTDTGIEGQWFLSDSVLDVGTENPAVGGAPGFHHNFELSAFPQTSGAYCFGDGIGEPCPCGNTGGAGVGCANSTTAGALLSASGTADTGADTFVLSASGLPAGVTAVFFQGTGPSVGGGIGLPFDDGLRCVAGGIIRLELTAADASGNVSSTVSLSAAGAVGSGESRSYQCWYRDQTGPCTLGSNTSNAWLETWL